MRKPSKTKAAPASNGATINHCGTLQVMISQGGKPSGMFTIPAKPTSRILEIIRDNKGVAAAQCQMKNLFNTSAGVKGGEQL